MNFLDLCYDLFLRTSKYHDLGKDIENWNKWNFYVVIIIPDSYILRNHNEILSKSIG